MAVALCEQLGISLDTFVKMAKELPEKVLEQEQTLLDARQHVNAERKTSKAARQQAVNRLINT